MAPKKSNIVLNVEQFIHDVEERPAIWNRNFHCNKAFLEQMWDELSAAHKQPKVILKAKWKGLRDNFRVEYKRIPRAENGDFLIEPAAFESKWIHYYALLFLTEHMRHRLPKNEQDQSFFFSHQGQDSEKTVVEPDLSNGLIHRLHESDDEFEEDFEDEDDECVGATSSTTTTITTTTTTPQNQSSPPIAHSNSKPTTNSVLKNEIFLHSSSLPSKQEMDREIQDLSKKSNSTKSLNNSHNHPHNHNSNSNCSSSSSIINSTNSIHNHSNSNSNHSHSHNNNHNQSQGQNSNHPHNFSYNICTNSLNGSISGGTSLNLNTSNNNNNFVLHHQNGRPTNHNFSPEPSNIDALSPSSSPRPSQTPPVFAAAQLLANALPALVNASSLVNTRPSSRLSASGLANGRPSSRPGSYAPTSLPSGLNQNQVIKKRSVSPPPLYNKAHHPLATNQNCISVPSVLSKDRDDFSLIPSGGSCVHGNSHDTTNFNKYHPYLTDLIPASRLKRPRLSEDSNFNGSSTMDRTSPLVPEDDDYHYLLSLHPYMKQLAAVQKLRIRTQIQKLILKELYQEDFDESK